MVLEADAVLPDRAVLDRVRVVLGLRQPRVQEDSSPVVVAREDDLEGRLELELGQLAQDFGPRRERAARNSLGFCQRRGARLFRLFWLFWLSF